MVEKLQRVEHFDLEAIKRAITVYYGESGRWDEVSADIKKIEPASDGGVDVTLEWSEEEEVEF